MDYFVSDKGKETTKKLFERKERKDVFNKIKKIYNEKGHFKQETAAVRT